MTFLGGVQTMTTAGDVKTPRAGMAAHVLSHHQNRWWIISISYNADGEMMFGAPARQICGFVTRVRSHRRRAPRRSW